MSICTQKVLSIEYPGEEKGNLDSTDVYLPRGYTSRPYAKSLRDPAYFLVKEITPEEIKVGSQKGEVSLRSMQDFFQLFCTHKTNWIGCDSLTLFLRWVPLEQVEAFYPPFNHPIIAHGHTLEGFPFLGRFKIDNNQTINLVNHFLMASYEVNSLEKVQLAANKLEELHDLIPKAFDTTSPGSTASRALRASVRPIEWDLIRNGDPEEVELMYYSYYTLPQDNFYIGSYPAMEAGDLKRAFLYELGKQLSYAPRYNIKSRATKYIKDAHAGWAEVTISIPDGMQNPPFPHRNKYTGHVTYPTGTFTTYLTKPHLDLAEEMGLQYKIKKAVWLIPTSANTFHPLREVTAMLESLLDYWSDTLYPVNLKSLYFTIHGHMLHMHEVLDETTGEVCYETSTDFHPGIASMTAAGVYCEVYRIMASAKNPYFLSADGGGAEKFLRAPENFIIHKGSGLSFNPGLKDKPGKNPSKNIGRLAEVLERQRDKRGLEVLLPILLTPQSKPLRPDLWGTKIIYQCHIPWSCGYRFLKENPKYNGELLERRFRATPPFVIPNSPLGTIAAADYRPLSLRQLLELDKNIEEGKV